MKRYLSKFVATASLCLLSVAAMAEIPSALAEKLVRKSGLWAQLESTPAQVQAGIRQSPFMPLLPPEQVERMVQIAGQSFDPARMRRALVASVAKQMQRRQVEQALAWYDSPTGLLMTALEEAASVSATDFNESLHQGNLALESASPRRQTLLTAVARESRAVQAGVDMVIHTAVAVFQGAAISQGQDAGEAAKALQAALEKQRPQMIAATLGQVLSMLALAYATASDDELEAYVQFLSSAAANHLMDTLNSGMDRAYTLSAQDFGKQLLAKGKPPAL